MTIEDFHLRNIVRRVLAASGNADPWELAAEVYKQIPKNKIHLALRQALKEIVRDEISRDRLVDAHRTLSGASGRSRRKQEGYQQLAQYEFILNLHRVPVEGGVWKMLRECVAADLDHVIAVRERMAAANQSKADWYRRIRKALDEHDVGPVGDLPESVLRDLLSDEGDETPEGPDEGDGEST